jgi:hypothetical protein
MSDSGHPSRHGFVQCIACGTWRRLDKGVCWVMASTPGAESQGPMCSDWAWCRDTIRGNRPISPVVSETAPKPGWDANGAPIESEGHTGGAV